MQNNIDLDSMISEVLADWSVGIEPPPMREFSRRMVIGGGLMKGHQYNPDSDPAQSWIIDQLDSGRYNYFYYCGAPQVSAKTTLCIILHTMYHAIEHKRDVGYALPTLQDLDKAWSAKLKPAFEDGGFGDHLPKKGPGARGGRAPSIAINGYDGITRAGRIVFLAGGAYGDTVNPVHIDEIDQFRKANGDPDWGAIDDINARADSFRDMAIRIGVGTIENDTKLIITYLVCDVGTGHRGWQPCVNCGMYRIVKPEHLVYDATDEFSVRESARIKCPHCGYEHDEDERQACLRDMKFVAKTQTVGKDGEIQGEAPKGKTLGLLLPAWDSSLSLLSDFAVKKYQADKQLDEQGLHDKRRKWYRYTACEPYLDDIQGEDDDLPPQVTREWMVRRSNEDHNPISTFEDTREQDGSNFAIVREVPDDLDYMTAAIDVQRGGKRAKGRLYFTIMARLKSGITAIIGWGIKYLSPVGRWPSRAEMEVGLDWLDQLLDDVQEDMAAPIVARGVDVGDRQDELVPWIKAHQHNGWEAIKGADSRSMKADKYYVAGKNKRLKPRNKRDVDGSVKHHWQNDGKWWLTMVNDDAVRASIHRALLLPIDEVGALLLASGLSQNHGIVTHICATVLIKDHLGRVRWSEKAKDKDFHPEWQERHDYLDCLIYCRALMVRQIEHGTKPKVVVKDEPTEDAPLDEGWRDFDTGGKWS